MVTIYKMMETEMGYRGSKSNVLVPTNTEYAIKANNTFVKEQRVDGSYFGQVKNPKLRCTLMGFERSYQVRFLSNQINKLFFSTKTKLNPYFITGFCDAESSFQVLVTKNKISRSPTNRIRTGIIPHGRLG